MVFIATPFTRIKIEHCSEVFLDVSGNFRWESIILGFQGAHDVSSIARVVGGTTIKISKSLDVTSTEM